MVENGEFGDAFMYPGKLFCVPACSEDGLVQVQHTEAYSQSAVWGKPGEKFNSDTS